VPFMVYMLETPWVVYEYTINKTRNNINEKKCSEMQTLHTGCSKAETEVFAPPQIPFLGVQDGQNLISWRWSLPSPTDLFW